MDKFIIHGGQPLAGRVAISGAKNAALPILFSTLLTDSPCRLSNVPPLQDVASTLAVLESLGAAVQTRGTRVAVHAKRLKTHRVPYDLVRKMRASVLALGPLLARSGAAAISLPGGCAIGARPIDYHLAGLQKMGAKIRMADGNIQATCRRLKGAEITLPFPSVTATENLMMAATLARGTTTIENAAREPEVVDLARHLQSMGARIDGAGHATLRIYGSDSLAGDTKKPYAIMPDRIEAGTFIAAVAACGGNVVLENIGGGVKTMASILRAFTAMGVRMTPADNSLRVRMRTRPLAHNTTTAPYPGFPTDMQAQMIAVNAIARGTSAVTETIFENRFMHVLEMKRMGADIDIRHNIATVRGVRRLTGAPTMATDLRASASLVVCALAAVGTSTIRRIYHLDRGYHRMDAKLRALGARIRRVRE